MQINNDVRISRSVFTLEDYNSKYGISGTKKRSSAVCMKQKCTLKHAVQLAYSYFPIFNVTRKYKLKEYLIHDILAGLTVSFIHFPQGLACGVLASLQPVHGIYTTFFPVLFYMIFGTSPYISFGPTANIAILTQSVVEREARSFIANFKYTGNYSLNLTQTGPSDVEILQVKVSSAAACSVLCGLLQGVLGFFRLGFLTTYLSSSFIGGFTTAVAIHVVSSQVPKLFGITTTKYFGTGRFLLTYIDFFRKLEGFKKAELVISLVCIAILLTVKVGINEKFKDKMKVPIPIDFILVISATLVSFLADFEENYEVVTIGPIPDGFTAPTIPAFVNVANLISDASLIAAVSLTMTITMAKLTAKKHNMKVEESQEIFAYGVSNILSGLFGCIPAANASSRTGVLSSLGARTTLNGLTTVAVFLILILFVGKFFVHLPVAVVASIIIISCKDMVLQYRDLLKIWKINKYDFTIWITTNICAIMLDLYYGLIIGLLCSFMIVIVQSQMESGYLIYMASPEYITYRLDNCKAHEVDGQIRIFRHPTNLYFATAEKFKRQLYKSIFDPELYKRKGKLNKEKIVSINPALEVDEERAQEENTSTATKDSDKPSYAIIDCCMISYIDLTGANILLEVIQQYTKFDITVYLTGINDFPLHVLTNFGLFNTFPKSNVFFEVFDAVTFVKNRLAQVTNSES